jgi:hypothetical protein
MATYKYYKLTFEGWADRISADKQRAGHWQQVFEQHPEFFRLDGERKKVSLVWRRQYPRRYYVDEERTLTVPELEQLPREVQETRISRSPLTASDISTLVKTAIELHSRALEAKKEMRWWLPLVTAGTSLLGVIVGALIRGT